MEALKFASSAFSGGFQHGCVFSNQWRISTRLCSAISGGFQHNWVFIGKRQQRVVNTLYAELLSFGVARLCVVSSEKKGG